MSGSSNLTTKIIITVLLAVVLVLVILQKSPRGNSNGHEDSKELSNRDIVLQEALNNPDKLLKRTEINEETYALTGYDDTFYGGGPKENKPGWKFGGIVVIKLSINKPVIFWESDEYINVGRVTRFQDINDDGIDEIVWEYDLGVTGRNSSLYVYKFDKDKFHLITPAEILESTRFGTVTKYGRTLLGGDSDLTYMKDIDNDNIQEILVGYRDDNMIHQQTYKFTGQTYELWREEQIDALQSH